MAPAPAPIHAPPVGSGKVTDSQVAFMVECYLRDSHFSRTLEEFRSEAARLLHPLRAVPKGARSLSAVLNDYVALKEEQISAAAEKARVEDLFHGLQEILSVYLAGAPNSNGPMAESVNGRLTSTFSPPHVALAAATIPQPHLRGSTVLEAGSASASADHSKQKPSSSKRKCLDNTSRENVQQGGSTVDPAKKSRCGSNVRQLATEPPSIGNSLNAESPTGSVGNMVNKAVQPVTPPMSVTSSSKLQQQQLQGLPSHALSGSPQPPLPTAVRSSLVSPMHTSNAPTPPSLIGDCAQSHQDPQTPPPSSIKSSHTDNCLSAPIATNEKCETGTSSVQVKPSDEQQKRKTSLAHPSSSTCPYALRAHKKPADSEAPCAALSDVRSNCSQKVSRKKASNSKCRLLDFSAAAERVDKQVIPGKRAGVSPSKCAEVSMEFQQMGASNAESLITQFGHSSDVSPSSVQQSQDSQASEFVLPCDTFSFDELFDLDLDTSLISELEDLAAIAGCDMDPPSCLKTSDVGASSLETTESPTRSILSDVGNFIQPDEAPHVPQCINPLTSPSKLRKSAVGHELDKENVHAAVVSCIQQTIITS